MIVLAATKHSDKYDKGNRPYILHPLTVMHRLRTDDELLMCIAVGHDLIEDTGVTCEVLESMGFPDRVVDGIDALTKRDDETYERYISRLIDNDDAVLVKMEDLRHNSDIRRLKGVQEKDIDRMAKYQRTYIYLHEIARKRNLFARKGVADGSDID